MKLIKHIDAIKPAIRKGQKHVQLRVYIQGTQQQFPTTLPVKDIDIDSLDPQKEPMYTFAQHLYACGLYSTSVLELREKYRFQIKNNTNSKINYEQSDFYNACNLYMASYSGELSPGYLRQYKTIQTVLRAYWPKNNLTVHDINTDFIKGFINHLVEREIVNGTINTYTKNINRVLRFAREELELNSPKPKIPRLKDRANVPIFLTYNELLQLEKVKTKSRVENQTLQAFLFMCYSGIRTSDFHYIDRNSLTGTTLQFYIQKQQKAHKIDLDRKPLELLRSVGKFKLPKQATMNRYIKVLCERAGIDRIITQYKKSGNKDVLTYQMPIHNKIHMHSGRKTWASIAYDHTKDVVLVSSRIGHKDTKTTLRYIGIQEIDQSSLKGLFS